MRMGGRGLTRLRSILSRSWVNCKIQEGVGETCPAPVPPPPGHGSAISYLHSELQSLCDPVFSGLLVLKIKEREISGADTRGGAALISGHASLRLIQTTGLLTSAPVFFTKGLTIYFVIQVGILLRAPGAAVNDGRLQWSSVIERLSDTHWALGATLAPEEKITWRPRYWPFSPAHAHCDARARDQPIPKCLCSLRPRPLTPGWSSSARQQSSRIWGGIYKEQVHVTREASERGL